MSHEPDELSELLAAPTAMPSAHRTALLAATTATIRRGARYRQVTTAVGIALVFVLGGASGWLAKPTPDREVITVTQTIVIPADVRPSESAPPPAFSASPAALELLAEQANSSAEAATLYRSAGDRYLADARDLEQAVRCYRLYFLHAGDAGRTFSTDDSWLLMSLKTAKAKETSHANLDS